MTRKLLNKNDSEKNLPKTAQGSRTTDAIGLQMPKISFVDSIHCLVFNAFRLCSKMFAANCCNVNDVFKEVVELEPKTHIQTKIFGRPA